MRKALRWLGHSYAFEVVQHFVGERLGLDAVWDAGRKG